jgi:hypothetical protein
LDDTGRRDLKSFFREVFGWVEGDNSGEKGNPLILYTGAPGEFVYLLPADPWLVAPSLDHFGLQVASLEELHEILDRARVYRDKDPRVKVIEPEERITHGTQQDYVFTSAYVGYLMPLLVELQHFVPRT